MTTLEEEVKSGLGKIGNDVNKFNTGQKERYGELETKHQELSLRLLDMEQKAARRGSGDSDPYFLDTHGGQLREAIEAAAADIGAVANGKSRFASMALPKGFMSPKAAILSGGGLALPDQRDAIVGPVTRRLTVRSLLP